MPAPSAKNAGPETLPLILEQKLSAFREFLSATAALKESLLARDMNRINALTDRRQGLIRHIDDLDGRIKTMTAHAGTLLMEMEPEKEKQIDALSTALEEAITKVIKLNGDCAVIAAGQRDALGKELSGINNGRLALRGYAEGARDSVYSRAPRLLSVST